MNLSRAKENFILEKGLEFSPQDFYIRFAYKTRNYAEGQLKKAICNAHDSLDDEDPIKKFLYQEYIDDDFQSLNESYTLDLYWNNTVKETLAFQTKKRKLDVAIASSSSQPSQKKLTTNKKRLDLLSKNQTYDFSNEGFLNQSSSLENWHEIKEKYFKTFIIPEIDDVSFKKNVFGLMKKKGTPFQRYIQSLSLQIRSPSEKIFLFKLLSHLFEAYHTNPKLFDLTAPCQSEGNLVLKMWGRIIEILFSTSKSIVYKSGDTVLKDLSANFKVDFRIGFVLNESFIDLANVEIGKFPSNSKIQKDHVKLLLEAKTIINGIISKYQFIKPTKVKVLSFQVCGLKGDLLCTLLCDKKKYCTTRVCDRLRVPLEPDAEKVMDLFEKLVFYKDHIEQLADIIKKEVNEALDRRSSFGKTLGPGFKSSLTTFGNWIDPVILDNQN